MVDCAIRIKRTTLYIYASRAERVKLVRENPIVVSNVAEPAIAIDYEEPF